MSIISQHSNSDQIATAQVNSVGVESGTGATTPASRSAGFARWLALGAIAGPVLFTLAWAVLGELSPGYTAWGIRFAPYSPIVQPISGLGFGATAPFMNGAFVFSGILLLVGAIGIFQSISEFSARARWICSVLFAFTGLGLMTDGIFTMQTFLPHFIGFALGSGVPVVGFLVAGFQFRRFPRWRRFGNWLLVASPLTLALLVLSQATFNQTMIEAGQGVAGLTERLLVIELLVWFVLLGWLAFRRS